MPVTSSIFREGEGDGYRTIPTITWLYLTVSLKRDTDPGGRRFESCPRYELAQGLALGLFYTKARPHDSF